MVLVGGAGAEIAGRGRRTAAARAAGSWRARPSAAAAERRGSGTGRRRRLAGGRRGRAGAGGAARRPGRGSRPRRRGPAPAAGGRLRGAGARRRRRTAAVGRAGPGSAARGRPGGGCSVAASSAGIIGPLARPGGSGIGLSARPAAGLVIAAPGVYSWRRMKANPGRAAAAATGPMPAEEPDAPAAASRRRPPGRPRFQRLRVIAALMLRGMGTRNRPLGRRLSLGDRRAARRHRAAGGRLQPGAALAAARHELHPVLRHRRRPLPASTTRWRAQVAGAIGANRGLLTYPVVTPLDAVFARLAPRPP